MYEQPAFPTLERGADGLELSSPGMTLRDYFAAQALSGILACPKEYGECTDAVRRVALAYKHADCMMAERDKGSDQK